jgi:hypothetical protein
LAPTHSKCCFFGSPIGLFIGYFFNVRENQA